MKPRILIAEPRDFSQAALELLRTQAEVELREVRAGQLGTAMSEHDAVWVRLAHRIDAATVASRGRCRVIGCPVTGLDHIDLEACSRAGLRVVSLRGEVEFLKEVRATAELTVALALAVMRQVPAAAESVKGGAWRRDLFRGHELYGKTVGIVGLGRLGTIVAGYFKAFGMRVLGCDVREVKADVEQVPFATLLQESDLVSLHVNLTPATQNLIGAEQLELMKPGAWLVNTSRGAVVHEASLLEALQSKHLAGAALDVLTGEPDVDAAHPLVAWAKAHPNLVIVPHIGGNTFESFEKTERFVATRMLEALRS